MNKYLKAISYNLFFFVISTLSFLILTPLAIRIMGGEFFGLWSILFAVSQLSNIGALGIGTIVNKLASEKDQADEEIGQILSSALLIVLPMALLTVLILFFLIDPLVDSIKPSSEYYITFKYALIVCTLGIIPQFCIKVFQGYFLSQLLNRFVRTIEFISSIFPWLGGVLITLIVKNLTWLAIWNVLIQVVILLIFLRATYHRIQWEWSPHADTVKRMLDYSKFMFIEWSAGAVFQLVDRVVVGICLGSVAAGIYSVATSVGLRLPMVSGYATEIMIPYASLKNSMGENETLYQSFRKLSGYINLITAGLAVMLILWMKEILSIWISPEYAAMYHVFFSIVILAYGFVSLSRPAHQTLTGLGHVKFTSLTYLLSSALMITGLFFFSQSNGLSGAAAANLIMAFLMILNIGTYKILNKKVVPGHIFTDLKWGALLPIAAYLVLLLDVQWYYRVGLTVLLGVFILITIDRDDFIKGQLKLIEKSFLPEMEA